MIRTTRPSPAIICLSHLRWDFVYQRPQHLLRRAARNRPVFFVEEPVREKGRPRLSITDRPEGVSVVVPILPPDLSPSKEESLQAELLEGWLEEAEVEDFVLWYYTPMAVSFTRGLRPLAVLYDCMDELSLFRGASPRLLEWEEELLRIADAVFTGGPSLYEAKQDRHPNVHLFPSSIERAHFAQAREGGRGVPRYGPPDQAAIPTPRLGYFGVIDERMDFDLLAGVADARPRWQIVLVGPVVKVEPSDLPQRPNLHYIGSRDYDDLPDYIAGWDVALIPFARNDATRFISPTKTPEYLAAGKPVVSTPIRDVINPWGDAGLVRIAETVDEFVAAVESALSGRDADAAKLEEVDRFLSGMSWDRTWAEMESIMDGVAGAARSEREFAGEGV